MRTSNLRLLSHMLISAQWIAYGIEIETGYVPLQTGNANIFQFRIIS
jgi:hypothetical protein